MMLRGLVKTAAFMCCAGLLAAAYGDPSQKVDGITAAIDLQGHRGARGLLPENTIPAFMLAMEWGVTTLEMDVAINRDGQAV